MTDNYFWKIIIKQKKYVSRDENNNNILYE